MYNAQWSFSPLDTLSICLNTVFGQSRGEGPTYILSGDRIWRETAERNFRFFYYAKNLENSGEIHSKFSSFILKFVDFPNADDCLWKL